MRNTEAIVDIPDFYSYFHPLFPTKSFRKKTTRVTVDPFLVLERKQIVINPKIVYNNRKKNYRKIRSIIGERQLKTVNTFGPTMFFIRERISVRFGLY